jgi:hypothetical protein
MAFEQKEFRLHAAAVRFLRTVCPDCITYHPANGEYRRPETARRLKAEGVLPGVFDLVLIDPHGKHFYLEAKSDTGRLSESQQWFKSELIIRGIPYVVFRSLDDVRDFIIQNKIPNRLHEQAARMAAA